MSQSSLPLSINHSSKKTQNKENLICLQFSTIISGKKKKAKIKHYTLWGFPGGTSGKEPICKSRRHKKHRFDPWAGKISWRRKWPLWYCCLGNPMDREAWLVTLRRVAKIRTQLHYLTHRTHTETLQLH